MSKSDHREPAPREGNLKPTAVPARLGRGPRPFLLLATVLIVLLALIPVALRRATWTPADLVIGNAGTTDRLYLGRSDGRFRDATPTPVVSQHELGTSRPLEEAVEQGPALFG